MKKRKIAIIGGGIGGLSLAYFLAKDNEFDITIFERNKSVGGLLGLLTINGVGFEGFYHHLFTSHAHAINLIKELELTDKLMYLPSRMGMYYNRVIHRFTSALDLLRFTPLPLVDRFRCGLTIAYLQKMITWKNWEAYRTISAAAWLRKNSGKKSYDVVWKPLLTGKFGDDAESISLAWLWHRIYSRGASRGMDGMKEMLVYLNGGFKVLIDRLVDILGKKGVTIRTNTAVEKIRKQADRLEVTVHGKKEVFDFVVATVPIPIFITIAQGLPPDYLTNLGKIRYRAALCIVLTLEKGLLPYHIYWLNINDRTMPFLAAVEHTNFVDKSLYQGTHIMYLGNYPGWNDPILTYTDKQLLSHVTSELSKLNSDFSSTWMTNYWVFKDHFAQPIVDTGYHTYIPSHTTPISRLYLMTMAQIYPEDRSTDCAIRDAKRLADTITNS